MAGNACRPARIDELTALPAAGPETAARTVTARAFARAVGDRVGIFCCRQAPAETCAAVLAWKNSGCLDGPLLDQMVGELAELVQSWQPSLPSDWIVTSPPQGASTPGPYGAGILAKRLAEQLDLDAVTCLARTAEKHYHGRFASLRQRDYRVTLRPPAVALVVDDLMTSRTTMRLALGAFAAAGVPAFGFVWGLTVSSAAIPLKLSASPLPPLEDLR